ncbi:MAG TPA: helix-turn-helix domain-containing protein [Thermoleophilaceae bacterium]
MPSIGETLREARMRQRLDITDVEAQTKIRAKYLRALENEEFSMLPGPTFVKTFLRTYAELLGLDPHRLVDEYRQHYESGDELEQLQPLGPPGTRGRERRQRAGNGPRPLAVLLVAAAAILTILIVLGLTAGDDGGDNGSRAAGGETTQTQTAPTKPRRHARPAPTRVALRIAPSEQTYICIDGGAGTDVRFEGILDAPQTFRGKLLRVNLGKTSVRMTVNGKPVPLAPSPNPAGFEFTPKRTRSLPLGERPCA